MRKIAFLFAAGLAVAACGGDVSTEEAVEALTEEGFTSEQAECVVEFVEAEFSPEDVQVIFKADTDEDIADGGLDPAAVESVVFEAVQTCL